MFNRYYIYFMDGAGRLVFILLGNYIKYFH